MVSFPFQVLDPELDLRTVKHSIWKSGYEALLQTKGTENRSNYTNIENETSKEGMCSIDS